MTPMTGGYPILLDLSDRLVVIVGGGTVALRKAEGLAAAGARRIRVVAPRFADGFPAAIERVCQSYQASHLEGAALAFAATDREEVNAAVLADARRLGIPANRADTALGDAAAGDFFVPAVLRNGSITVAVSCAGAPALAAALRDHLRPSIEDDWAKAAEGMRQLRPRILSSGLPMARRREIFRALAGPDARRQAAAGPDALRDWLLTRYPELKAGNVGP